MSEQGARNLPAAVTEPYRCPVCNEQYRTDCQHTDRHQKGKVTSPYRQVERWLCYQCGTSWDVVFQCVEITNVGEMP
jgi:hypothetical protein